MSGFEGDDFRGERILGLWPGVVVDRDDPKRLGRVRVRVPGIIDEKSTWAMPRTGGSTKWGGVRVPPTGTDVLVQFVGGDVEYPVWEPGPFGIGENFPEHEDVDVSVFGEGHFRIVLDHRSGSNIATWKMVKEINGVEEDLVTLEFNGDTNSMRLFATTALQIEAGGIVDIDCAGDVQIKGRKVIPKQNPIN